MDKKKILLVEDDEFILDLYSTKFSLEDFEVLKAKDGVEGLELFKKDKPDFVLLDIKMPKMDGWEVLKEIRKQDKKIPVIIFTNVGKEDLEENQPDLANDYLVKSFFTPEEVVSRVRKILGLNK